ncbi:hypothetical protein M2246_003842 [Bacillus sp. LEw-kw-24]|nr:hypothetical protein [Bacillus sp. LEw-kw-24]MDH6559081.1 hypothetical protein [Bacillus sp. LEw-kw-2]MDH8705454.1 hypothetical protein [Stenotrophomonas sp. 1198]MDP9749150.1 hypothetical protein [Bacillus thuringiensis]
MDWVRAEELKNYVNMPVIKKESILKRLHLSIEQSLMIGYVVRYEKREIYDVFISILKL